MSKVRQKSATRRPSPIKLAIWTGACALLLTPLVAMQITKEVAWTASDFLIFGAMLFGALGLYELAVRGTGSGPYRWAAGVAVATGFFLVWANLAVGLIGNEDDPANWMFLGVLAVALLGASGAGLRANGMAYTLFATAFMQLAVGIVALVGDLGANGIGWPRDVIGLTCLFTSLWLAAAFLFRRAAREEFAV